MLDVDHSVCILVDGQDCNCVSVEDIMSIILGTLSAVRELFRSTLATHPESRKMVRLETVSMPNNTERNILNFSYSALYFSLKKQYGILQQSGGV